MRMIIKKFLPALAALALPGGLMSAAATVRAAGNDIQLSGNLTREDFRSLTRQLGFAASYFPLAPAAPLGILGLDAGVEATSVKIAKNSSFWQRAFRDGNPPSYLAVPRLHVQKGLPFDLDIGASFTSVPSTNISIIGGEIKWAILEGGAAMPAVAGRVIGTNLVCGSEGELGTYSPALVVRHGCY